MLNLPVVCMECGKPARVNLVTDRAALDHSPATLEIVPCNHCSRPRRKTTRIACYGEHAAQRVAIGLIELSISFAVEPTPNDNWCFEVYIEDEAKVTDIIMAAEEEMR